MRIPAHRTWILAVGLILPAGALSAAQGQSDAKTASSATIAQKQAPDPTDALRERAASLLTDRDHYREAATLLLRASSLTPVEDERRAADLHLAGNLFYYVGDVGRAAAVMTDAAEASLARGDVEGAANALLDAAWLSVRRHQQAEANRLALQAMHLTASPLLSTAQRDGIRSRVANPELAPAMALPGEAAAGSSAPRTGSSF